jgi:hypothetical protein
MKKLLLLLILCLSSVSSSKKRAVQFRYPYRLLPEGTKQNHYNVSQDEFLCFENMQEKIPPYRTLISCLLPYQSGTGCEEIWGSHSVVIKVLGDIEFIRLASFPSPLPDSSSSHGVVVPLSGVRLLQLVSPSFDEYIQEIVQFPSEKIIVCARSSFPFHLHPHYDSFHGSPLSSSPSASSPVSSVSSFSINFKNSFIRDKDKKRFKEHLGYHILMLLIVSSLFLLPYLVAFLTLVLVYLHGIKFLLVLLSIAITVICLTPVMLTKKNRQLASLYVHYFFSRKLEEETKQLLRASKPVFTSLYFSSLFITFGTIASYICYHYFDIGRELRNFIIRITLGIAISWFVFFFCRAFDRYLYDWIWFIIALTSLNMTEEFINPAVRPKILGICLVFSFLLVLFTKKYLLQYIDLFINRLFFSSSSHRHHQHHHTTHHHIPNHRHHVFGSPFSHRSHTSSDGSVGIKTKSRSKLALMDEEESQKEKDQMKDIGIQVKNN